MMFLPVDGQVVAAFAALGISSYINYCARQDKGAAIRAISAPARRKKGPREASHLKKSIFFARAALAGFQERFDWFPRALWLERPSAIRRHGQGRWIFRESALKRRPLRLFSLLCPRLLLPREKGLAVRR